MPTLVYRGGSSLTFGSDSGRRTVLKGEPFDVSDELAELLLADPAVEGYEAPAVSADVPRGTATAAAASSDGESTPAPTKAQLLELATVLGLELPKRATNDTITAAIAAEQQRLADEAAATAAAASSDGESDQGGSTPADDPDAPSSGEAGTPPSETGAVTLSDIPDSAKVNQ